MKLSIRSRAAAIASTWKRYDRHYVLHTVHISTGAGSWWETLLISFNSDISVKYRSYRPPSAPHSQTLGFCRPAAPHQPHSTPKAVLCVPLRAAQYPSHTFEMSSYFSSLAGSSSISTALSSRLNSLRRAITLGDEVDDPDNEDCSHISNALRAYYTEKGRLFPSWLPPDPKAPQAAPARVVATSQLPSPQYGQGPATAAPARGGGLSDLWGDSSGTATPPPAQTASLRRGRGGASTAPPVVPTHGPSPGPVSSPPPPLVHAQSYSPRPSGGLHPQGARPLPSQRQGSYQTAQPGRAPSDRSGSAQERLRARLHGGRSPSPNVDPSVRKPGGSSGRPW